MNAVAKCSILAWTLSAACACGAGLLPYGLECEARQNPVGIDVPKPRLGWKLRSDQQNQTQGAYQVALATSPERLDSGSLMPGTRAASPRNSSRGSSTAATALRSFQRYWWKVRVWDGAGTDAGWSQPAEWTTALSIRACAGARGLRARTPAFAPGRCPCSAKSSLSRGPCGRRWRWSRAPDSTNCAINGAKVGDHVLAPAWTNFRSTVLYETFDVSPLLKTGRNASE